MQREFAFCVRPVIEVFGGDRALLVTRTTSIYLEPAREIAVFSGGPARTAAAIAAPTFKVRYGLDYVLRDTTNSVQVQNP